MMKNPLPYLVFCGLAFGGWPLIARFAGNLGSGWMTMSIACGTFAVALFWTNPQQLPAAKPLFIWLLAGVVNGLGLIAYTKLVAWKDVDISKTVSVTAVLIPILAAVGALLLFGEPLSIKKIAGVGLAIIAVYLLN